MTFYKRKSQIKLSSILILIPLLYTQIQLVSTFTLPTLSELQSSSRRRCSYIPSKSYSILHGSIQPPVSTTFQPSNLILNNIHTTHRKYPIVSKLQLYSKSRYSDDEYEYYSYQDSNSNRQRKENNNNNNVREVGYSKEENELRNLSQEYNSRYKDSQMERDYYDDYEYEYIDEEDDDGFDDFDSFDDNYDDDYSNDNDNFDAGNYWYNSKGRLDSYQNGYNSRYSDERGDMNKNKRNLGDDYGTPKGMISMRRKRTKGSDRKTFRSGNPPPPAPIKELYDKLFWYGFDPDESTTAADRTMFGGTKGKFNGLDLLSDVNSSSSKRKRMNGDFDDFDDDDLFDEYDYRQPPRRRNKMQRYDEYDETRFRPASRRKDIEDDFESIEEDDDDWEVWEDVKNINDNRNRLSRVSTSRRDKYEDMSSWFEEEDSVNERSEKRKRKGSTSSPIINLLDTVFQVNPEEVKLQADDYDKRVGLDKWKKRRGTSSSLKSDDKMIRRRKGYAYPYYDDDEEEIGSTPMQQNFESIDNQQNSVRSSISGNIDDVIDVAVTIQSDGKDRAETVTEEKKQAQKRVKQSWKDRAEAFERVPPKGVKSWGPEGEIDEDILTQAAKSAIDEIRNAKMIVESKREKLSDAEEEMILIKSEAAMQKKRLLSRKDPSRLRIIRERLRIINLDVENTARFLRRAKKELQIALENVEELENRHHALISQYEADDPEDRNTVEEENVKTMDMKNNNDGETI